MCLGCVHRHCRKKKIQVINKLEIAISFLKLFLSSEYTKFDLFNHTKL